MTEALRADTLSPRRATPLAVYYAIFTLSGFAGLIYESIWSHYLKLLLGHAAYAQTLVLAIFMGGLALGSWWIGARSARLTRLLLGYALVEAVVGVCALGFHPLFVAVSSAFQNFIAASELTPQTIEIAKWSLAALLIAPQSCLLGMTFPLLSAGLLRAYPAQPGKALASLYCCNSLGATFGVLASGLWLIAALGLPGTIALAGALNLLLAATVWLLNRDTAPAAAAQPAPRSGEASQHIPRLLLAVAAFTGLSSFIYELSWIRMLSMVLGAATHSFELMLSAFILGLALGGLWIRRRIDQLRNVFVWLAWLQIAMGICALASLLLYSHAFEAMSWLMSAVRRSAAGYDVFLLGSHALALLVMLPATFCAGTTLPLITHALLRDGHGERAIGRVYAANTLGAIAGVLLTVHLLLPWWGLCDAMVIGAAIDLMVGVALLAQGRARVPRMAWRAALISVLVLALTVSFIELDPRRMASGVYRYGRAAVPAETRVIDHADGKTASISLLRYPSGKTAILTNGKPDASINPPGSARRSPDEVTMVLLGALPLAIHPDARRVANIGMGSGLTSATLLASNQLERVDTIEIEAKMVEAARAFLPRTARTYQDPRSHIVIDDAKTYFLGQRALYDVIVSEPSNPWVSGVASLFSSEFYALMRRYLKDDGVLVQWLQLYEFNNELLASVINALSAQFPEYLIYQAGDHDLVVVASQRARLGELSATIFDAPLMKAELASVGIHTLDDLRMHRIAGRATLEPLFTSFNVPANSDFYPYVDQRASKARFLDADARALVRLTDAPLPLLEMLDQQRGPPPRVLSEQTDVSHVMRSRQAQDVLALLLGEATPSSPGGALRGAVTLVGATRGNCANSLVASEWRDAVFRIAVELLPKLDVDQSAALLTELRVSPCAEAGGSSTAEWLALSAAVGQRQPAEMAVRATALLEQSADGGDRERRHYLVAAAMLGALANHDAQAALATWNRHAVKHWRVDNADMPLRLLLASALFRAHDSAP